jgi:hypothetical protein
MNTDKYLNNMITISIMYNGKDHPTINSLSAIASNSYNQNNAFMIKMYISRENKEKMTISKLD